MNSDFSDIASTLTGSVATNGVSPITAALKNPSGTNTVPGISFSYDPTVGFYLSAAGTGGIAASGVSVGTWTSTATNFSTDLNTSANSTIGGNLTVTGNATIGGSAILPTGIVLPWSGSAAPSGWLLCFGQAISRTTYANLFAVTGTTYGAGDASTTFNIPDLRGRAVFGKDDMGGSAANRITNAGSGIVGTTLGASGGAQNVILTTAQLASHIHTVVDPTHTHGMAMAAGTLGAGTNTLPASTTSSSSSGSTSIAIAVAATGISLNTAGGDTAHTNMSPAMILNYIIKT